MSDNELLLLAIVFHGATGLAWFLYWWWVAFFKPATPKGGR